MSERSVSNAPKAADRQLSFDLQISRGPGESRIATAAEPSKGQLDGTALPLEVPTVAALISDLAFRHGSYFDSYLAVESNRKHFVSPEGMGVVSYVQYGRYLLVGGGLIAPDCHRKRLLELFMEFAASKKLTVSFYNIGPADLPYFRELKFQITKWGEEPIVDLNGRTWRGKAFEWVRRQTNYCQRKGLMAFETRQDDLSPAQWARCMREVQEVSAESISAKPQKEMTFFEGSIVNNPIGRRRLFVARSDEGMGRIEGFVICNPIEGGRMWSTELYRRRLDSVRGTMAFLFHYVLLTLQDEGVEHVPMCLDLGKNIETSAEGDSFLVRHGLILGRRCLNGIFNFAGMQHFKSRFRPRYEDRFVCVLPKTTIGSSWAFLRASGVLRIDTATLAGKVCKRLRAVSSR
ncbi:MAG TPA: DUF2156 domain-containing protein [Planctomycetes bacterium]|nr:DUF2156 domain-containing protein [Fuerstiella sp.]HIK92522.1 DUF2156 domain-containing protein [Planctomycetota bacterium]